MEDREQQQQIGRVRQRISSVVLEFVRCRLASGRLEFAMPELHAWVQKHTDVAPASPDRILRDLRQRGLVEYEVVDRRRSLYRLTPPLVQKRLF